MRYFVESHIISGEWVELCECPDYGRAHMILIALRHDWPRGEFRITEKERA